MMSTTDSCKDGASKSNYDDGVYEVNDMLHNMSTDDNDVLSVCANCGKEGNDVSNVCNKCKQVKYCNAACKKKHRHKHKNDCEEHIRQAAKQAAKLHDIELFKQPPPPEDCLCFVRRPILDTGTRYMTCCGKVICGGCFYSPVYDNQGNEVIEKVCPFCRTAAPTSDEEIFKRTIKRMETGDAEAIHTFGKYYF